MASPIKFESKKKVTATGLSVRFYEEDDVWLERMARAHGCSMASIVREIVSDYRREHGDDAPSGE